MYRFSNKDLELFKRIAKLTQPSLKTMLKHTLKKIGDYEVCESKSYVMAKGDIPIVLIAHMDTVFSKPPESFYYDQQKQVLWSPDGLGADDRAGVFAILKILASGLRPHVIFTCDEEVGGFGAEEASKNKSFLGEVKYIIELDRRGIDDCVFYNCANPEFVDYVETFGFEESYGSFSDISIICPAWKTAGVNLSIGYENEHTPCEILRCGVLLQTVDRVKNMLTVQDIPSFIYVPDYGYSHIMNGVASAYLPEVRCRGCGRNKNLATMIEVEDMDEDIKYYCGNCFEKQEKNISWCYNCGYPYEVIPSHNTHGLCYTCYNGVGGFEDSEVDRSY